MTRFAIDARTSVAYVQAQVRSFVRESGGTRQDEWCVAIAASEAATNIAKFATRGTLSLRISDGPPRTLELRADDDGPGMPDLELAMKDGISEGIELATQERRTHRRGLGTGLGAIARAMDSLRFEDGNEGGTRLVSRRALGRSKH